MKTVPFFTAVLFVILLTGSACKPGAPSGEPDSTAPEFVEVKIQLESPNPPNPRGEFIITGQDVTKDQLGSDLKIRLIALAGDPESGIASLSVESELSWQCSLGPNSEIIGTTQTAPLAFSAITNPASPITPLQINVVADPVAQAGCDQSTPGKGPVNLRGFVRVTATNGAGMQVKSKTFVFDYANIGSVN